jgi:integrase/recombinase XerD
MTNEQIEDEFFQYLKIERQYSENTISSYRSDILSFQTLMEVNYIEVSVDDAKRYYAYLRDNYANNSVLRKISSIKSMYKFLESEKIIDHNVWLSIHVSKRNVVLPKFLSVEQINLLLNSLVGDKPIDIRNKAMFEVLYATGMRISELIDLHVENINFEERFIKVHGKGNKERIVPMNDIACKYLSLYINHGRLSLMNDLTSVVFLNNRGSKLSRQGFYKILKEKALAVGIVDISPHKFRHSIATHMLNEGANLKVVQELLGHENISTTQIYSHVSSNKIINEYNKYHIFGKDNDEEF